MIPNSYTLLQTRGTIQLCWHVMMLLLPSLFRMSHAKFAIMVHRKFNGKFLQTFIQSANSGHFHAVYSLLSSMLRAAVKPVNIG